MTAQIHELVLIPDVRSADAGEGRVAVLLTDASVSLAQLDLGLVRRRVDQLETVQVAPGRAPIDGVLEIIRSVEIARDVGMDHQLDASENESPRPLHRPVAREE